MKDEMCVTLANVTAGKLSNTPFQVSQGTWSVTESASGKYANVAVSAAADISVTSKAAFGTWYLRMNKKVKASSVQLFVSVDKVGSYDVALSTGYLVYIGTGNAVALYKVAAGTPALLATTANDYIAADTEYEICVTRDYLGVFNLYVKGGAYAAWTLALTATDTTYATSNFINFFSDGVTDKIRDLRVFAGALDPTKGELPI
jgi:hypothetical protein